MLATMSPELQKQHERMNAYEMLEHLQRMFKGPDGEERFNTSKALYSSKQGECDPVGPHVLKMIGYIKYLDTLGSPISPEYQIDLILQSLNSRYSQLVINYNMNEIDRTPTTLLAMLRTVEINIKKADPTSNMMVNKWNMTEKG